MKNKRLLYILIPGTLLVWGMIVYRIFLSMNTEKELPLQQMKSGITQSNSTMEDTFSIKADYRDPFLGKMNKKVMDNKPVQPVVAKVVKATAPWPAIVYGGTIKNQKSNKQLALVQINGQGYTMKAGEIINGVQLNKIFKDSIEVKYLKEKKIVSK